MSAKKSVGDNLGIYLLLGALVLVVLFYQPGILLAPEDNLTNCQERLAAAKEREVNAWFAKGNADFTHSVKEQNYFDLISLEAQKNNDKENLIAEGSQMSRDILDIEDQINSLQEERRIAPPEEYGRINQDIADLQTRLDSLEEDKLANSREVTAITNQINSITTIDLPSALSAMLAAIDARDRAQLEYDRAKFVVDYWPSCESSYVPDEPYVPWVPPNDSDSSS